MKNIAAVLYLLALVINSSVSLAKDKIVLFTESWMKNGTNCGLGEKGFQRFKVSESFFIFRQSLCENYEAPFIYLIIGNSRAFLFDTGATYDSHISEIIEEVIGNKPLLVAHSHSHGDHTAGDQQFAKRAAPTQVVTPSLEGVMSAFGITNWPKQIVTLDIGERRLEIIPIPGHERSSIAVYDPIERILLTGDTVYPGRLYISQRSDFIESLGRLVQFADTHLISMILGAHIEMSATPKVDIPIGSLTHSNEHPLALSADDLVRLWQAAGANPIPTSHVVLDKMIIY